jgi:uncharacterized membrane protein YhaH (DUF805 family)
MPDPLHVYLKWQGRISRKTFWLFSLPTAAIYVINEYFITDANVGLYFFVRFILAVSSIMMYIKRSHDLDRTGWFTLLLFVPLIGIWPMVEFFFFKGTDGSNRFGNPVLW